MRSKAPNSKHSAFASGFGATRFGIPSPKGKLDDSQIWDFAQAGRYEEIAEYCRRDVEATRTPWRRFTKPTTDMAGIPGIPPEVVAVAVPWLDLTGSPSRNELTKQLITQLIVQIGFLH